MRIRTIKPQFFVNEEMAQCQPLARLAFIGLICAADREGRLEDRPARLKIEILPYDDADMNSLISELEEHRFVRRYEVGGSRFIWVCRFKEHQRITGSEAERQSLYPPPPEGEPSPAKTPTPKRIAPSGNGRFTPPSIEECQLHAVTVGLPEAQAGAFFDYYGSKGWKVGKSPMKDWKLAMSGWKRRWQEQAGMAGGAGAERPMSDEEIIRASQ